MPSDAARGAACGAALDAARSATLGAACGATVYTNAPERRREAVFGDLCTLLRPHGPPARPPRRSSRRNSVYKWPRTASKGRFLRSVYTIASPWAARATLAPQQCTQMPQNGSEEPFSAICVHYCVPLRHHGAPARPSRRNSVHKWPRTASKGRFRRSVYTIGSPWAARVTLAPQQCTQMPRNGVERPFSAICVHYCIPTGHPRPHRPPAS